MRRQNDQYPKRDQNPFVTDSHSPSFTRSGPYEQKFKTYKPYPNQHDGEKMVRFDSITRNSGSYLLPHTVPLQSQASSSQEQIKTHMIQGDLQGLPGQHSKNFLGLPSVNKTFGGGIGQSSSPKSLIEQQLDQMDDLDDDDLDDDNQSVTSQTSSKVDEETSFVSNMTERKRIEKKVKIVEYLEEHRNNLPTERLQKLDSGLMEESFIQEGSKIKRNPKKDNLLQQLESIKMGEIKNKVVEKFIIAFNKDPEEAIDKYIKQKIIKNSEPKTIATYLLNVEDLNKGALGEYFGKNNQRSMQILRAYCDLLQLKDMEFDLALRKLLSRFKLPGEAQQIERIVWEFALSYYQQNNQNSQCNADELFPLAYAIIMLATDAHNPKNQNKMSCMDFVKNTQRACPSVSKTDLEKVYERITKQKLETENTVYDKMPDLYLTNLKQALEYKCELKKGMVVQKIVQNKRTYFGIRKNDKNCEFLTRRIFLSADEKKICWVNSTIDDGKEEPRFILIDDITDLTIGIGDHLATKKNIPQECDVEFFTITTEDRTLDIRTQTAKIRSMWLNYLRAVMIQKRHDKIEKLQAQYREPMKRENLENVWTSEIFPNWDKYWDYDCKRPKQKWYFQEQVEKFCYCFTRKRNEPLIKEKPIVNKALAMYQPKVLGMSENRNILQVVWKFGLLESNRKTLWEEIIGNTLQLNSLIVQETKKRSNKSSRLREIQEESEVIEIAEFLITVRPDLPHLKELVEISRIFNDVFKGEKTRRMITLANFIHKHHFLSFYKGDKIEIQLRTQFFEYLLKINVPFVGLHFKAIKLQTRSYLIPWFLSIFYEIFEGNFLLRIWDNFILEGQIYLFKVGVALIKYYEIELKMCASYEGLKILKFPSSATSEILFFDILEKQVQVSKDDYFEFITKRKHAMIKTKIQSIPLEFN